MTIASLNSGSLVNAAFAGMARRLPVVDTHQHLVDVSRFGEKWARPPVPGNFGPAEYKKATRGLNFVKSVYLEVAVPADKRHEEALYAIEVCNDRSNITQGAVINSDIYDPGFANYMSQFRTSPCIKGIRPNFKSQESVVSEQVVKNVKTLGALGMSLDFIVRPSWLPAMYELAKACPGTAFMINHCGNVDPRAFLNTDVYGKADHDASVWVKNMTDLASLKNTALKISGIGSRVKELPATAENLGPAINQCLNIFGPDRVMFASDWPWCLPAIDIKTWVGVLKSVVADRPYVDQKKLFHDNAIRLYRV
jgi:predicted TIM-barrel fold metal-dependent hydrolase